MKTAKEIFDNMEDGMPIRCFHTITQHYIIKMMEAHGSQFVSELERLEKENAELKEIILCATMIIAQPR